jgi:hypothetical protein
MATERKFKLKKGTEFPEAYAGIEVRYTTPDTLAEIEGLIDPSVPADKRESVIVSGFNGQGYSLSVQKRIKDLLNTKEAAARLKAGGPGDTAPEIAQDMADKASKEKLGAPRAKGEGTSGKVAKAEAKAEAATSTARNMYLKMPAAMRKQFRPELLAAGTFTEEQLDEMDAEAGKK